ncbi:hypothetical protein AYO21_07078 [Fonsecaea monophora]|uniref:Uncharacterized protein n=1 Tax=Fonsecaea monophora TaxID=254056 RepID=A0A177F349_9EURO|nr:hypothetical protein AYO21_07078 [Fonsecaea monophora]OAG38725.1 hypothetical protein AYO21_07078 [Fonsecaea monophora]
MALVTLLTSPQAVLAFGGALLLLPLVYYASLAIYNIYFHPLAHYPGPILARASHLWRLKGYLYGTEAHDILEAHNKYGGVVRLAPDELSYVSPIAWKQIYGHKTAGQPECPKDPGHHADLKIQTILNADQEYHGVLRRLLAHSFSDKALREQESVLLEYADIMVRRIGEEGQSGARAVDIVEWYNFFTFDVIGYLTYGETFGCLSSSELHPWIDLMFVMVKQKAFYQCLHRLPSFLRPAFNHFFRPAGRQTTTTDKIQNRIHYETKTLDLVFKLIEAYKDGKMSFEQLESNTMVLIVGGAETTATLLSGNAIYLIIFWSPPSSFSCDSVLLPSNGWPTYIGATYYLLTNPASLARLTKEVRTTFASPADINLTSVNGCPYLLACLEEALRVYPPSPQTHTRKAPRGGVEIDGQFVPENTTIGVPIYAACHSFLNFGAPDKFIPERWLGNEESSASFARDRKDAAQVFSVGPRACIGRNLALLEMRLVMAKLLWHYDLKDCSSGNGNGSNVWADQRMYMLWDKPPLMVKLVKRDSE